MNLSQLYPFQELINYHIPVFDINNNPNSGQIEKLKALCKNIFTAGTVLTKAESR